MTPRTLGRLLLGLHLAVAACALTLPSCATDGHFSILGYSTKPNYDRNIRTVRVPIFKNKTFWVVTPVVGMEMDLTRAVVREIEAKTPYKVVQDCAAADTELRGTIVSFQKAILNFTPFNTVREAETILTVELVWRDLRTGQVLSRPARRPGEAVEGEPRQPLLATPDTMFPPGTKPPPIAALPAAPESVPGAGSPEDQPIDPATQKPAIPIVVRSVAHYREELGESTTTALQRNYDRLAVSIVSLMETGW